MISVILYGRNDSHGYNLHKRAAISLNCIAEALTDDDDEILFVDYNTPNDLPTFIEAIYDTLTPKARSLLRVLRVRPEVHAKRIGSRTHLLALEPHSRNIGIRRSNPRNRWVLFTNTDMVFVPRGDVASLTAAVCDLPDSQYILPRFELPEPLWEGFPRSDPQAVMRMCDELGSALHLNEVTITHPYMRFDSPGDFQLAPRQALFDIHGFDERMIHGWHADSNMCKRLYVLYERRTESLAHRLKGYHCDHTRVATLAHRLDIKLENDLQEFVYGVEDPYVPQQGETWGMPEEDIEEVDFADGPQARFVSAVKRALGQPQDADYNSNAIDLRNYVFYHPEHALPYLAGNLTVHRSRARIAYVGANPRMYVLASRCLSAMGFSAPLQYLPGPLEVEALPTDCTTSVPISGCNPETIAVDLLKNFDVLIFDFGLEAPAGMDPRHIRRVTQWPRELRYKLGSVAQWLEACAVAAQRVVGTPDFLVLNANHYVFSQFVSQFLIATDTPYNTHVRRGRPRTGDDRLYRSNRWKYTEQQLRSWCGYGLTDHSVPVIHVGQVIDLTSCGASARYKDGDWGAMDMTGTWTDGGRADLLFCPPPDLNRDLIAFVRVIEAFLGPDDEPIRINVYLDGVRIARWTTPARHARIEYKVVLPYASLKDKQTCRLRFEIDNPVSAELIARLRGQQICGEDPRELGVKIQRVTFSGIERLAYSLRDTIDFTKRGAGVFHLNEGWTQPDKYGAWTLGRDASFTLYLEGTVGSDAAIATFTVNDAAISQEHPQLQVAVSLNGRQMADWRLGPTRRTDEKRVIVPSDVLRAANPLIVCFRVEEPRSPAQLKWSETDTRQLGFRLTKFRMDPVDPQQTHIGTVERLRP